MEPRVIFERPSLMATVTGEGGDSVVFTFDHWRHRRDASASRAEPSVFAQRGLAHVRIRTARNDWFLCHDLPDLLGCVAGFARPYARRMGVGFSMGGYGLLILSRSVPLHRALFLSPHTTPFPDLPKRAPFGDHRFQASVADPEFARAAHAVIRASGQRPTECAVLFDPVKTADAAHANSVARHFETVRRVEIIGAGHPVTTRLPPSRTMSLIHDSLTGDRFDVNRLERAIRRTIRQDQRATLRRSLGKPPLPFSQGGQSPIRSEAQMQSTGSA